MVSPKKLMKMARKWRLAAATRRQTLSLTRTDSTSSTLKAGIGLPAIACKGHFIVYSSDGQRFMVPLAFLSSEIFKELFRMAEEEFGLPGNRPIVLPCDAISMEKALQVLSMHVSKDVEKAFLNNIITVRCSTSFFLCQGSGQLHALLHGF